MRRVPDQPTRRSVSSSAGLLRSGSARPAPTRTEDWIQYLQRAAGNRAVVELLAGSPGPVPRPGVVRRPVLQRAPAEYEPGESERATARGVISPDVRMLAATGSGFNASASSVLIADFRPNSAVVRTSAAEDLARGSWLKIIEADTTHPYAVLGFTDATGPEGGNTALRQARARSVAAVLPGTTKRGVVGAAPVGDYVVAGNATPEDRALNRSVLIRLPFEELREAGQVDRYAGAAVTFWRANPTKTVTDLLTALSKDVGEQLGRNAVPPPDVVPGTTVKGTGTLAYFTAQDWQITVDATALSSALPQKGVTPTTALSTLSVPAVAYLAQACYHEARHAEQDFQAARTSAEEDRTVSPDLLGRRLGIRRDIAEAAIAESAVALPDVVKTKAAAWRTFMKGGRHIPYRTWNEGLKDTAAIINANLIPKINANLDKPPDQIRQLYDLYLHPVIDKFLRRKYSYEADGLRRDLKASPHQDQVDLDVRQNLETTAGKLFILLAKEHGGAKIPDAAALAKLSPEDALMAKIDAKIWLLDLELGLWDTADAADAAYRAYPNEKDAYEVGALVTDSVTEQGTP